jgi:RNA polymerase sigma factor (sigma-70 family)
VTPPTGDAWDRPDPAADDAEARRLIERIYAGEPELAKDLYERYRARLYGFVSALLGGSPDAEDVTHEVFETLLKALLGNELRKVVSLRKWLFGVARNHAADHRRKHGRVELAAPEEIRERVAHLLRRDSRAQAHGLNLVFDDVPLAVAVRCLSPRRREVVLLRYVGDFDLAEIAATIGGSEVSVRKAHSEALATLRARFGPASTPEEPRRKPPLAMSQLRSSARRAPTHSFSRLDRP